VWRLTDDQVERAADILVGLREGRLVASGLPEELTPDNTADIQVDCDMPSRQRHYEVAEIMDSVTATFAE